MKKIMTIGLVAALAVASQAATIQWGNSGTTSPIVGLDGVTKLTSVTAPAANFSITLMYLDSGMVSYPGTPSVDTLASTASFGKTAGQLQNANDGYTFGVDYTTGDQFFIRATATFGAQQYYMDIFENNTYGDLYTVATTVGTGTDTFVWAAGNYGGVGTEGTAGKWVPVPEPATAALALAGLAMLIRRRK